MRRWLGHHGIDSRLATLIAVTLSATVLLGGILQGALSAALSEGGEPLAAGPIGVLLGMAILAPAIGILWFLPSLALFALSVGLARKLGAAGSAFGWASLVTAISTLGAVAAIRVSESGTVGQAVEMMGLLGAIYLAVTPLAARLVYAGTPHLDE